MAKKRDSRKTATAAPPKPAPRSQWWIGAGLLLAALLAALQAYSPVLHAPFVFDDEYLPFNVPNFPAALGAWLSGVRPMLMFSYWLNFRMSGLDTASYHWFNVLFHAASTVLVFYILRNLLRRAGLEPAAERLFALFGAALFLLHPAQTESVAYVASRSENLAGLFMLAALLVFLARSAKGIPWPAATAVLALYGCAVATKEHAVVLPALLLLTDYFWNTPWSWAGARRNWRVYAPIVALAAAGVAFVVRVLSHAQTAGFRVKDFTWYQYFFTECRAVFVYVRLYLLPVNLTADYDFAISHSVLEHGAIVALVALAALGGAALYFRKRYPLACYGFLWFIVLLAPTSSFVPIQDPVAERRLYLPMIGLILITIDVLRRVQVDRAKLAWALAAVTLAAGVLCYRRNLTWSSPITLWEDTAAKSPRKPRAHFQLAYAYFEAGRCRDSVREYDAVAALHPADYRFLMDSALAYNCANRPEEALERLRRAAQLQPAAQVYLNMAMVYAGQSRWQEALDALASAEKLDAANPVLYVNRAGVHAKLGEFAAAETDYRRALELDPGSQAAVSGLNYVLAQRRAGR